MGIELLLNGLLSVFQDLLSVVDGAKEVLIDHFVDHLLWFENVILAFFYQI
jgi:hypothetical protein